MALVSGMEAPSNHPSTSHLVRTRRAALAGWLCLEPAQGHQNHPKRVRTERVLDLEGELLASSDDPVKLAERVRDDGSLSDFVEGVTIGNAF